MLNVLVGFVWGIAACLLLSSADCEPTPVEPVRTVAITSNDSTLVLMVDVRPGMWAAHRDSLDWRTYLTATPRPDSAVVRLVLPDTMGTFVLYNTGREP